MTARECVQVNPHNNTGKTIEEREQDGRQLHPYACSDVGAGISVNHYSLFERETS